MSCRSRGRCVKRNARIWIKGSKRIEAENERYVTVSVSVLIDVLMRSLSDAIEVTWVNA